MTYRGHVKNGLVVFDKPNDLPEGAAVTVDPVAESEADDIHPEVRKFSGILPPDFDVRDWYVEALLEKHR